MGSGSSPGDRQKAAYDIATSFEVVHDLRRALEQIDLATSPTKYAKTVADLCHALFVGSGRAEDLRAIIHLLPREPRDPELDALTCWLRGLVFSRCGAVRHAARLLDRADQIFRHLRRALPMAQVALDLTIFYSDLDRWADVRRQVTEVVFLLRHDLSIAELSAVILWRDAVLHGDVCDGVVRKVRTVLAGVPAGEVGIPPSVPRDDRACGVADARHPVRRKGL